MANATPDQVRGFLVVVMFAAGCQPGLLTGGDEPIAADAAPAPDAVVLPDAEPGVVARAVLDSPRHGEVHRVGSIAALRVHGWVPAPSTSIAIQALEAGAWVEVATAITADAPGTGADGGMYELAATVPIASLSVAWPRGGVLRVRAVTPAGEALAVFGEDAETSACLVQHGSESWTARATACAYPVTRGATLVSVDEDPAAAPAQPPYLDRKGAITTDQTAAYYDVTNAAATLDEFRTRYGLGGPAEAAATYYNSGDLAVGRDMHCVEFDAAGAGTGLACYSSNYGEFSGDVGLALGASLLGFESGASEGAFATVAMVYTPPIEAPNSVSFVVFGADGSRIDEALLDQVGDNVSVPNNCLNCHGSASAYDPATSIVTGARFLPFDPLAMEFATGTGYTLADQSESLRRLNAMVGRSAPAPGVQDFLAGMYPDGVETPAAPGSIDFVPPGWAGTIADRSVYRQVVAPLCRGCHQTHVGAAGLASTLAFRDAAAFRSQAGPIRTEICADTPGMPNAEATFAHLRNGAARAYLVDFLDLDGACVR